MRNYAPVILFAVAFAFLLALPFRWPPVSDAAHYVYASQSLLDGRGLRHDPALTGRDSIYTEWPPLQPMILAAIRLTGIDIQTGIRLLNATCYALVVVLIHRQLTRWRWALTATLFTPPFFVPFMAALSEPVFLLLLVVFFALLFREPLPLLALSMVAALMLMQRYSAVVPIAVGAVYIVLRRPQTVARMAVE